MNRKLRKLLNHLEKNDVPIEFSNSIRKDSVIYNDDPKAVFAAYRMSNNSIIVTSDSDSEETIYAIAHEFGHHMDFLDDPEKTDKMYNANLIAQACQGIDMRIPIDIAEFILNREKAAFRNANKLLKELNIKISESKKRKVKNICYSSYRQLLFFDGDPWN